ncbi:hypothetical protein PSHT_07042 [Puccinia striiformis]|uniref:Uncharacterized protein n=1 Tax=Puccinia striiformis TaxID=27350 RepID=A0A2S4W1Z7_9BASI|nr:hypothetical protein PSHT_07042 [Puccinia striiformis]
MCLRPPSEPSTATSSGWIQQNIEPSELSLLAYCVGVLTLSFDSLPGGFHLSWIQRDIELSELSLLAHF